MPESTQQKNDQYIPASLCKPSAVSSKWNIYIICKPACQADMPSFPEILYAYRAIRMPEIFHKPYSHHTCRTSCNICISRKITINLNRKKHRSQNRSNPSGILRRSIYFINIYRQIICHDNFFVKSPEHQPETIQQIFPSHCMLFLQLSKKITCSLDRTCNQLWKERYKQSIA